MYTHTRALSIIFLIFIGTTISFSQCPVMPKGFLCITTEAGNKAAENARVVVAQQGKIDALQLKVDEKDKSIQELKDLNLSNTRDLTDRIHKTEVDLALKTGQLIASEAEITRLNEFNTFMLQHGRVKQFGLINLKF